MKTCIIKQTCGLGDIFFCQKIAWRYYEKGYKIVWPVKNEFYYLSKYLDCPFNFPIESIGFPHKDIFNIGSSEALGSLDGEIVYLPLAGHAQQHDSVMISKYKFVNIDHSDWIDFFNFKRDYQREEILRFEFLNLKSGEKFNLVNLNFVSPPETEKIAISPPSNGYRNIVMDYTGYDNVFDWCWLFENAEEIHTVNTSICYIIEKLKTNAKLFMYHRRKTDKNFDYIKGIYKKPWEYINHG